MTQLNPKRVLLLVIFVITLGQTAQLATSQPVSGTLTEGIGANGQINWTEGVIIVTGQSAINPKFANNPAQQKLMAMRFAQVDAYRNLAEVVNGIRVASSSYEQGIVGYSKSIKSAKQNKRAGNKPFVVKGLKASGANNTDIVISNTDAQTLLGMKENLSFLDRCRVMVVVD